MSRSLQSVEQSARVWDRARCLKPGRFRECVEGRLLLAVPSNQADAAETMFAALTAWREMDLTRCHRLCGKAISLGQPDESPWRARALHYLAWCKQDAGTRRGLLTSSVGPGFQYERLEHDLDLAWFGLQTGDLDMARASLDRAATVMPGEDLPYLSARYWHGAALFAARRRCRSDCFESAVRSMEFGRRTPMRVFVDLNLGLIAEVLAHDGQFDLALEFSKQAVDLAYQLNHRNLGPCLMSLARVYLEQGQPRLAARTLATAQKTFCLSGLYFQANDAATARAHALSQASIHWAVPRVEAEIEELKQILVRQREAMRA